MSPGISCSIFGRSDYNEVVDLLTESFCKNDPIETALQITPNEFRTMVEFELQAVVDNRLGVIARQAETGRLAGVVIAADARAEQVKSGDKISPKFDPINEIARSFNDFYMSTRNILPGSCLYLFMVGVHPEMTGNGIAKKLFRETLGNAESKGYKSAFSMTTNLISTNALKNIGFLSIKTLHYQSYYFQGRPVFSSITDNPGVDLLELNDLSPFKQHP